MARRAEKLPWGKFEWSKWLSDPKVKLCSLAAQGLWMRMLCIAAEADPVGYVIVEGRPLTPADLASESGKPLREINAALADLQKWGVFSTDRRGRIYSRKMVRDVERSRIARENGGKGGNPNLGKRSVKSARDNQAPNPKSREKRIEKTPQAPQGGLPIWNGPEEVWRIVAHHLQQSADGSLRYFDWREVPTKALVTGSPTMFARLAPCRTDLMAAGWDMVLEQGKVA